MKIVKVDPPVLVWHDHEVKPAMRKQLIIHIGLYKTGTTAIQAFLAQNVALLADCGIAYPFITDPGAGDHAIAIGNIWLELIRLRKASGNICSKAEMVRAFLAQALENALNDSTQDTVLVSCEHLSSADALRIISSFSGDHDVRIIAYVRDPYDLAMSSWKQRVKSQGDSRPFDVWLDDLEQDGERSLLGLIADFARSGLDLRLLSYDSHREQLIESFLAELGIEPPPESLSAYRNATHNRSLSFEQAMLVVMALRDGGSSRVSAAILSDFLASPRPFKDPTIIEFDERILETEKDEIRFLNSHLSFGDRLRTEPRAGIRLQDAKFSAESVRMIVSAMAGSRNNAEPFALDPEPHLSSTDLPRDFDPEEYLWRNPDVAKAGLPAEFHYLNHGRWENRVYKALRSEPDPNPIGRQTTPVPSDVAPKPVDHPVRRERRFSRAFWQANSTRDPGDPRRWLRSLAFAMLRTARRDTADLRRAGAETTQHTHERYETSPKMSSAE